MPGLGLSGYSNCKMHGLSWIVEGVTCFPVSVHVIIRTPPTSHPPTHPPSLLNIRSHSVSRALSSLFCLFRHPCFFRHRRPATHQDNPLLSLDDIDSKGIDLESAALELILQGGADVELDNVKNLDELQLTMQAHSEDCYEMEVNPVLPLLSTSSSYNTVRVWKIDNLTEPELLFEFVGHTETVSRLTMLDNDSRLLTSSIDYKVHLYDLRTIQRDTFFDFGGSVLSMTTTPDERHIYVGGNDYDIKGYSVADGKHEQIVKLVAHSGKVVALAMSPDGEFLASGGHDFNICLWKLEKDYPPPFPDKVTQRMTVHTLKPYARVEAHRGHVLDLAFSSSAQGNVMLSSCGNDHALKVWEVKGRGRLNALWTAQDAHESAVSSTCFGRGPSSQFLYSCGWDAKIRVWNAVPVGGRRQSPEPVAVLRGHTGRVASAQTSDDGRVLVSISADYTARLWEAAEAFGCLCVYRPLERMGQMTALGVGKRHFATGSDSGVIRVWPLFGSGEHSGSFKPFEELKDGSAAATGGSTIQRGMSFHARDATMADEGMESKGDEPLLGMNKRPNGGNGGVVGAAALEMGNMGAQGLRKGAVDML